MLQRLRAAGRNDGGFTLIELLIVIVILGVLSGVVVFAVGAFNNDGVVSACKADRKNVEIAAEAYYAKVGSAASAIDDAGHTATTLVGAGYLKEAPNGGGKYTITFTTAAAGAGAVTSTGC